ncbi:MAG: DsbA family protein [Oscillospiraceae bacterium]|jgi:predicted DsbA family dithiol-disulfide isomerase|nr:DsbA family protein [Oscillospiraceae bacterium]
MRDTEIFFAYSCPFCLKGYEDLKAVLAELPDAKIIWRPCEVEPREADYGNYDDFFVQASLIAIDLCADMIKFNDLLFNAIFTAHSAKPTDRDSVIAAVESVIDADALRKKLGSAELRERQNKANDLAYETHGVWAVPSFRADGGKLKLDAVAGVGVSRDQIREFLS